MAARDTPMVDSVGGVELVRPRAVVLQVHVPRQMAENFRRIHVGYGVVTSNVCGDFVERDKLLVIRLVTARYQSALPEQSDVSSIHPPVLGPQHIEKCSQIAIESLQGLVDIMMASV